MHKLSYLFIVIIILFGCENANFSTDCSECYQIEPDSADIHVKFTINDENGYVPLVVYKGDYEDNVVEWTDTTYDSDYYLYVPVNEFWSVKAKYIRGTDTIYAIDGDKIKTDLNTDDCDVECYEIKGGKLDVRLKDFN